MTKHIVSECQLNTHQDRQEQSHVTSTEDGKEHSIDHELGIWGGKGREQVDNPAQDQIGLVVVVLMDQVPVCHPARGQLSHSFSYTCMKQEPNSSYTPTMHLYKASVKITGVKQFKNSLSDIPHMNHSESVMLLKASINRAQWTVT